MTTITYGEALKVIRATATGNGMTFKREETQVPSGNVKYKFVDNKTGKVIGENFTMWTAYEDCMSGFVDTMNIR